MFALAQKQWHHLLQHVQVPHLKDAGHAQSVSTKQPRETSYPHCNLSENATSMLTVNNRVKCRQWTFKVNIVPKMCTIPISGVNVRWDKNWQTKMSAKDRYWHLITSSSNNRGVPFRRLAELQLLWNINFDAHSQI
jgi:hypothetical protein